MHSILPCLLYLALYRHRTIRLQDSYLLWVGTRFLSPLSYALMQFEHTKQHYQFDISLVSSLSRFHSIIILYMSSCVSVLLHCTIDGGCFQGLVCYNIFLIVSSAIRRLVHYMWISCTHPRVYGTLHQPSDATSTCACRLAPLQCAKSTCAWPQAPPQCCDINMCTTPCTTPMVRHPNVHDHLHQPSGTTSTCAWPLAPAQWCHINMCTIPRTTLMVWLRMWAS